MAIGDPGLLNLTNGALGVFCALLVAAVLYGVAWEFFARRRERGSLPDRWPPVEDV